MTATGVYPAKLTIREEVELAPMTTLGVGGAARYFCEPMDLPGLLEALDFGADRSLKCILLGNGSNVVVADGVVEALVVRLAGSFKTIEVDEPSGVVTAGAAAMMPALALQCAKLGYTNLNFLGGIPGTVGGGVAMNAGAHGGDISSVLEWAETVDLSGEMARQDPSTLGFGYRDSAVGGIVTGGCFRLGEKLPGTVAMDELKAQLAIRKKRQPSNPRNCGSVFKNPPEGLPAGTLIDQTNLKGFKVGGAMVSRKHANWFEVDTSATGGDVRVLISEVKEKVAAVHGIELEREVVYLPEDF